MLTSRKLVVNPNAKKEGREGVFKESQYRRLFYQQQAEARVSFFKMQNRGQQRDERKNARDYIRGGKKKSENTKKKIQQSPDTTIVPLLDMLRRE